MSRSFEFRLRKLENRGTDEIVIWCDEASEVPATVDQMIADGGNTRSGPATLRSLAKRNKMCTRDTRAAPRTAGLVNRYSKTRFPGGRPGNGDPRTSEAATIAKEAPLRRLLRTTQASQTYVGHGS
jgi:hypothetical protein